MADPNIIQFLINLAGDASHRGEAAHSLATHLGGEELMIFLPDAKGSFSAPKGFPKEYGRQAEWKSFLAECGRKGTNAAKLPVESASRSASRQNAKAWRLEDGTILVILGSSPDPRRVREVRALLPILSQVFRTESELARSQDELQQFTYAAGHDLKEPLRAINANAELLKRSPTSGLSEDARKSVDFIWRGAQRLDELTRSLVSYGMIGSSPSVLEPVEAEAILVMAEMNLETLIREQGASITHDPLPRISGDQMRLVQVFQNLLQNAIRYRSAEAPRAHTTAQIEGKQAIFSIKDNGEGIDARFHDQIFKLFKRLHGAEIPGAGLGLCTCRKIIEMHGGRIWLESSPGAGSTFFFALNIAE